MSLDGFVVRAGDVEDLGAVLSIQCESEGAPQWSEAVWREFLQTGVADGPVRQLFVAADGERVAGFVVFMISGEVAEIESVAVAAELRRRGLADTLCRAAMQWAVERGVKQVELEVRSQAAGARALYASLGFAEQGVRRGYYQRPEDDAVLLTVAL